MMLRFCFRVFIVDKSSSGLPTFSLNFGGDKRMSLEMSQEVMARTPPWPPVSYSRRSAICSQTRGLILGGILVQFSVCVLGAAMQCNAIGVLSIIMCVSQGGRRGGGVVSTTIIMIIKSSYCCCCIKF